ncbi:MAG TPA: hypothetical protein VM513_29055 [Kofleriaceae bacterium]|nr:hypothetical protein [Kofleriaceae bacterium]
MSEVPSPLPFELVYRGKGLWRTRWTEEQLFIAVGGTEAAPAAPLVDTLRDVVTRWGQVKETIATFVRGLASGHHVPLDPSSLGGFAARSCGFDQPLSFESISVKFPELPHRVVVTFYTGYPDGYATYAVTIDNGVPTAVSAFAS